MRLQKLLNRRLQKALGGRTVNWNKLAKDKRAQAALVAIIVALVGIGGVQCDSEQRQVLLMDAVGAIADSATDSQE